ncbi:MAG: hypothetical protein ACRCR9_00095 [Chitinophagaceae bacterium]
MDATLNRKFWMLLKQQGLNADQKDCLVLEYTANRTHHSSEMSDHEASELIKYMSNGANNLRRQLIAMSYSIGEDVNFVKGWCEKYGIYGGKKKFNSYSVNELIGLREKFRKVVKDREEAVISPLPLSASREGK